MNFVEVDDPKFDEVEFKTHLVSWDQQYWFFWHKFGREKVSSEKAFLMCLWYFANLETFRQISTRFNITQSTALHTVRTIVDYFSALLLHFLEEEGA